MTRPIDVVRRACPRAKPSYLAAIEQGDALFAKHGITTPMRLAHFLAQVCHETGGLSIERESGNYKASRILEIFGEGKHSAKVTAAEAERLAGDGPALFERVYGLGNPRKHDLGNTQPGDGWKYRGGGLLQTTGRANYRRMGERCGVDFEGQPDLVLSAAHALKPALAEWSEGNLNDLADANNISAVTRSINGGYNGLADRQAWFAKLMPMIDRVTLNAAPAASPASPIDITPPAAQRPEPSPPSSPASPGKTIGTAGGLGLGSAIAAWFSGYGPHIVIAILIVAIIAGVVIHVIRKKGD